MPRKTRLFEVHLRIFGKERHFLEEQRKVRFPIWIKPKTREKMDRWLELDNCKNESEYIEKAIIFYTGYLETNDASAYLCKVLSALIQGTLDNNNNRLRSLLFKWAVELNICCHTVAAHFGADEIDRRELRAFAVEEVKRSCGQISFDHALDVQRDI